ncbi:hypothetical protein [Nocardiopsis sp. MG754419]|uniref:hypothetical protein n=1 Tax=Nocardiopsis sp. MG754419 TaxID=2259865 RepID=UPI001BA45330|nr:hypothetical protein [Nocardiopsis sp. MG754419]MBR8743935.1 hypothetical protein [Nocardiopsis sp. MG754419]
MILSPLLSSTLGVAVPLCCLALGALSLLRARRLTSGRGLVLAAAGFLGLYGALGLVIRVLRTLHPYGRPGPGENLEEPSTLRTLTDEVIQPVWGYSNAALLAVAVVLLVTTVLHRRDPHGIVTAMAENRRGPFFLPGHPRPPLTLSHDAPVTVPLQRGPAITWRDIARVGRAPSSPSGTVFDAIPEQRRPEEQRPGAHRRSTPEPPAPLRPEADPPRPRGRHRAPEPPDDAAPRS